MANTTSINPWRCNRWVDLSESGSSDGEEWGTVDSDTEAIERMQELVDQTPPTHPEYPRYQEMLGQALTQRYLNSGDVEDLQAGLEHRQQAVNLTPKGNSARPGFLRGLAVSLTEKFWLLGDLDDLNAAVESMQQAVDLAPTDHPERAQLVHSLAATLLARYQRLGNLPDLECALKRFQQTVDLTPAGNPSRAKYLCNLGSAFTERYQRLGEKTDLEVAMRLVQKAVDLTHKKDPERPRHLQHLAACYTNQYKESGNLDDLEAALKWDQKALDLTRKDDPERAGYLQNVAASFTERFQRLGKLKDLEKALQLNQEAVDLIPEDDPDRVSPLQSLSISLKDRYRRLGRFSDLEAALQHDQQAVALMPTDHRDRAASLQRLAVSLTERFKVLGDLKDLEAALQNDQQAVDLTPANDSERAKRLQSLGISLKDHYSRLGDLKDLEAALHSDQEAVDLTTQDSPDRAACLHNLATSFKQRYERLDKLKDLEGFLKNAEEALKIMTFLNHPDRPLYLHSSAVAFAERYKRLGDEKDLETAVQKFQEVISLIPDNHPDKPEYLQSFAHTLTTQYDTLGSIDDLESALKTYQKVVELTPMNHRNKGRYLQDLAAIFMNRYERFKDPKDLEEVRKQFMDSFKLPANNPEHSWHAALEWASFAEDHQAEDAPKAYSTAFHQVPEILWLGHAIPTRHEAIRRLDVAPVASAAMQTCIKLNDLKSAVEIMEQGLATTFQQMLQLKPDVGKLSTKQAGKLQKLSSELYTGTPNTLGHVAIERKEFLDEIRKEPGLEYFLLPKPYIELCKAAQKGPVVILNSHEGSCDAVIILNSTSEPVSVSLPSITLAELQAQKDTLKDLLNRCGVRSREASSTRLFGQREGFKYKPTQVYFEEMLAWLWKNVVEPIYVVLKSHGIDKGRIWWLPTGAFTGLPLHASPPSNQFIHSYTATLGSLLDAQSKKSSVPKVGVVGVTHTGIGSRNQLMGVVQEVKKIPAAINSSTLECLEGDQATPEAVKLQLQNCSWVHLACHGTQDLVEPTRSHLLLYEGELRLETILQMTLTSSEFVFLAACQTAMGDAELVNESFHLGGGFIAAGFRSAVGTLWSMNDEDGPLVAEIFYSHLFRNGRQPKASDTAEALQLAVNELRSKNVPYERWIPFIHMGV
ncbi:CHAT domain-containing protein [Mycena galericulata]|nr:CHAT domain-containing protein [Mycena galericulata]